MQKSDILKNKTVILGVCGGIAAYKACEVVSALKKLGASVNVIMTKNACEFVTPKTFETLSNNKVIVEMFEKNTEWDIKHISLAKKGDIFVVAPATMNIIGKLANGICDDMLSTTYAAFSGLKLICPAMNDKMFENEVEKQNLKKLGKQASILNGAKGMLACGDIGSGRMAEPKDIVDKIIKMLMPKPDYLGKNVLVTAGATIEKIDDVRYLTNFSSGKMGCEIAKAAAMRGANVRLIAGNILITTPEVEILKCETTLDMYDLVMQNLAWADVVIKAAAPVDYTINKKAEKIKDENLTLSFTKNPDIAKAVGENKGNKKLVIFCAETNDLIESAKKKLVSKNADMVVANNVLTPGAGFNTDTNIVSIVTKQNIENLDKMLKSDLANVILDKVLTL